MAFGKRLLFTGGLKSKQVGAQNEDILRREIIEPYTFRATKADWTDLPPKMHTTQEYKLSPEMKRMYDQMYNDPTWWPIDDNVVAVDAAITNIIETGADNKYGDFNDEDKFTSRSSSALAHGNLPRSA